MFQISATSTFPVSMSTSTSTKVAPYDMALMRTFAEVSLVMGAARRRS